MLAPFIPHACEEMWEHLGHEDLVYRAQWPTYDESAMVQDTVEIVVQLNGKVKERVDAPTGLDKDAFAEAVMKEDKVKALLEGKQIIKVIAVPGKLLNVVVK